MSTSDPDALFQGALGAAAEDDHTTALRLLKAAADAAPERADIAYALGAEYGYVELFDAAEAQMDRALGLDADAHAARMHLGLLLITRSRFPEAMAAWQPLGVLPKGHALRRYKAAFDALAEDRLGEARDHIEAGLAAKGSDRYIDDQMRRLQASLPGA